MNEVAFGVVGAAVGSGGGGGGGNGWFVEGEGVCAFVSWQAMECRGVDGVPVGCVLNGSQVRRCPWECIGEWLGSVALWAAVAAVAAGEDNVASKIVATAHP